MAARAAIIPPQPYVTSTDSDESAVGLDYAIVVTCRVSNRGGDGNVRITADMDYGSDTYSRDRHMRMAAGGTQTVRFTFTEVELFGASRYRYRCVANAY